MSRNTVQTIAVCATGAVAFVAMVLYPHWWILVPILAVAFIVGALLTRGSGARMTDRQ